MTLLKALDKKENKFSGTEIYDLDTIIVRACFACEKKRYHVVYPGVGGKAIFESKRDYNKLLPELGEHELWVEHIVEPLEHCIHLTKSIIQGCHNALGGLEQRFFLSGKGNFRYDIATVKKYKGNRDPSHRPVHLQAVREWAIRTLFATVVDGAEADDGVGISSGKGECAIISNDKDLRQLPGWHYNFVTKELRHIGKREAGLYFFQQLLAGDPTDNVPGIEGLGEVGALAILDGCGGVREAETRVLQAYQERYGIPEGDKRFLETGRLVKIRQHEKETLWTPRFYAQDETGAFRQIQAGSKSTGSVGQGESKV